VSRARETQLNGLQTGGRVQEIRARSKSINRRGAAPRPSRLEEEEEEEEERLYLHLKTRERVQTNEAKSKRCRASPTQWEGI